MPDIDPRLEACCRAMCIAQGDDPDAEGRGMGHSMPLGSVYKLWEQRVPVARAIVLEWLKQEATAAMLEVGYRVLAYEFDPEGTMEDRCAALADAYSAMHRHAAKEIA